VNPHPKNKERKKGNSVDKQAQKLANENKIMNKDLKNG
jgi:hypothetical protein